MMKETTREKSRKNEKKTCADDFMHYCYQLKLPKKPFCQNFITMILVGY